MNFRLVLSSLFERPSTDENFCGLDWLTLTPKQTALDSTSVPLESMLRNKISNTASHKGRPCNGLPLTF
ncbi:MAG: hypothetical protein RIQ54_404 [Candidatus Parcubacteria bacterium]